MRISISIFFLVIFFSSCLKTKDEKPTIIFIIADDLGYTDLAVYGSDFYNTPNIDALSKQSVLFTNGYANSPVCSPARASFQTGKYPVNTGVTDWIKGRKAYQGTTPNDRWIVPDTEYELKLNEITIAEKLKANGYATAFIGKWHLGETEKHWPKSQGYDINIAGWKAGSPNKQKGNNGYFSPYGNPKLTNGATGEYLPDRLTDEALSILKNKTDKPLFLCLSYYLVHAPFQAKESAVQLYQEKRNQDNSMTSNEFLDSQAWMKTATGNPKRYKERIKQGHPTYAAMVKSLDENVGRIIDYLKESGTYDNSLIVFVSDNGGLSTSEGSPTSNLPLAKGKGWMYEGGIRVPYIIKTPGQKSSKKNNIPVSGVDLYPTILDFVEIDYSKDKIDGISLKNIIKNPEKATKRPIYWHYPHYSNQGGNPGSAIRLGDYKLIHDIETNAYHLFNLKNDIGEINDLIRSKPQLAKELKKKITRWIHANYHQKFKENPNWNHKDSIAEVNSSISIIN